MFDLNRLLKKQDQLWPVVQRKRERRLSLIHGQHSQSFLTFSRSVTNETNGNRACAHPIITPDSTMKRTADPLECATRNRFCVDVQMKHRFEYNVRKGVDCKGTPNTVDQTHTIGLKAGRCILG